MRKKRILWCNEFSLLSTGYAVYGKEIMSRLYNSDKYEIAELALYVSPKDPRVQHVPWRVYANAPEPDNQEQVNLYKANPAFEFGAARFEEVVLDFKPDIVISIMDPWMFDHMVHSPLRKMYHLILMPTVDSAPQQAHWMNMFIDAQNVFTYSDYGHEILKKEASGLINLLGSASPAADVQAFNPVANKQELKDALGLRKGIKIIGTVMRNQKRKLYPDILQAYQHFLDKCAANGQKALARDTLLYWHTTYPDMGWEIPSLLRDSGLGHRVLFTYSCRQCGNVFASFFQGPRTFCTTCNKYEASMPSTQMGVDDKVLGQIMNIFDVYLQYSIAEGFGMPLVEAAACGIPSMATDYSASGDIIRKIKGVPIPVKHKFLEAETRAYRVYPDNEALGNELYKFFNLPDPIIRKKSQETRKAFEENYSYDTSAKRWSDVFDNLDYREFWDSQPRINQPPEQLPPETQRLTNNQFIQWALINILGEPERVGSYLHMKLVKDLTYGAYIPGYGGNYLNEESTIASRPLWQIFNREQAAQVLLNMAQARNYWEARRVGLAPKQPLDYLENVKRDAKG